MSDDIEEMGPIDWILLEYDEPPTGEAIPSLIDLVERGVVRILDLVAITKDADGTIEGIEITDLPGDAGTSLAVFEGARSGLLGDEDVQAAADALEPGTTAVLLVWENAWAAPFATAVRRAGGRLVDSGRIPVQAILAALDELEALEAS